MNDNIDVPAGGELREEHIMCPYEKGQTVEVEGEQKTVVGIIDPDPYDPEKRPYPVFEADTE